MEDSIAAQVKERFSQLPKVVQDSITSADVQKELRSLSDKHKLHVDQWGKLEDEVILAILGFQSVANLAANIQSELQLSAEDAASLAKDINQIVFEPIRGELERQLEHPEAKEKVVSAEDATRQAILSANAVVPATPPTPKPTEKAVRAPLSSTYTSRQPSTNRSSVSGDPYRETPQ